MLNKYQDAIAEMALDSPERRILNEITRTVDDGGLALVAAKSLATASGLQAVEVARALVLMMDHGILRVKFHYDDNCSLTHYTVRLNDPA